MPTFLLIPLILLIPFGLHAREIDRELLQGYETALLLCNRSTGETESLDAQLADRRQPPCSTFKIYNTLIGLELGLLSGPDDAWYQWDGVTRHYDTWNRDLTLRQAFSVSAVPAYQGLARQIGPERMKAYIDAIGYGSGDISSGVDTFWLPRPGTTPITISAREQAELLAKLLDGTLPFLEKNVSILKEIMHVAQTPKGTLYGKTGSGTDAEGKANLGWFVGFVESRGCTYVFACNITRGANPSGTAARQIVENVLKAKCLL
ncbi:MAG: class D beta-lactamase [Prosthecochloris sp.]|nr:class D beta-lactamase [Prosthecochloris sp.]